MSAARELTEARHMAAECHIDKCVACRIVVELSVAACEARIAHTARELDELHRDAAQFRPRGRERQVYEDRVRSLAAERVRLWTALGMCHEHGEYGCDCEVES